MIKLYRLTQKYATVKNLMLLNAFSFIIIPFLLDSPTNIINGLGSIILSRDILLTDYFVVGGIPASFLNAGLIMLISIILKIVSKSSFTGTTISCIYLVTGFSFIGKNIYNIWPIIIGVLIFTKINDTTFSANLNFALYGTALGPLISELTLPYKDNLLLLLSIYFSLCILGYIIPLISSHALSVHQGYSLYNTGFATGLICMFFVSFLKRFGFSTETVLIYDTKSNWSLYILFYIFVIITIIVGFILNSYSFNGYKNITKHSGRLVADFVIMESFGITMINMGVLGFSCLTYLIVIKAPLNGIALSAILSIYGFGSFGKHLKNCIPIILGVIISTILSGNAINTPVVILATLFSTGLAPIAGHFGIIAGIIAGVLHNSIISYIGVLYFGLNLYNNGFSCGFVAMFLLPILENVKIKIGKYKRNKLKNKAEKNEKNI